MRTVTRTAGYLVAVTLFTAVIGDATAAAQPAYLVRDVNAVEVNDGSGPEQFVVMDDRIYFTATDNQHGEELWTSDGTEDGTELVKDVCPGPCYSRPLGQTVLDHTLYFLAFSGALSSDPQAPRSGSELWKSDGTPQGTERVRKVCSKYCPSYPSLTEIVAVDGHVYFAGHDSALGEELWKSDGTPQGTGPVVDLCPGECSSFPTELRVFAGRLFFRAMDDEHGDELWVSDGSAAGTELVKDICPGECASRPSWLTTLLPDKLLFVADDGVHDKELWMSDGTAAGTVLLADIASEYGMGLTRYARLGEPLYFIASGVPGVWKTDGTPQGTQPAPELMPNGSTPDQWQVVGDRIFFTVRRTLSSAQLWVSDGTVAGIRLLDDGFTQLELGPGFGDRLLFVHFPPGSGDVGELWRSNGTKESTRRVGEFVTERFLLRHSIPHRQEVFLAADDGADDFELWASDGSADGTVRVRDLRPATSSSSPERMVRWHDRVFFTADDGTSGRRLWASDGTEAGTERVEATLHTILEIAPAGDRLFLTALGSDDPSWVHHPSLWSSDGSAEGAVRVSELRDVYQLTPHGEVLYFSARVDGQQLWASDGTPAGTRQVIDVNPSWTTFCPFPGSCPPMRELPDLLTPVGALVFFIAQEEDTPQLWRTDGTAEGTLALGVFAQFPEHLVDLGGTLLFSAFDEATGWALWASDGSPEGTHLVIDPTPEASSEILHLVRSGDRVDFVVRGEQGDQLWRTDGTAAATRPVSELTLDGTGSRVASAAAAGERLFLSVEHDTTGEELWTSDGTAAGTFLVADLQAGRNGSRPRSFTAAGDRIFFAADDGTFGQELWTSDGTPAGTYPVADVAPGPAASGPAELTIMGEQILFAADDGQHGRELFAFDLTGDEPPACPDDDTLCLRDSRFRVEVEWVDFQGNRGPGRVVPFATEESGLFWFFSESNWEMMVKVLDGCDLNGHFWVFSAATTNVEYTLRVTDNATDELREYFHPAGQPAPAITDTSAFATCLPGKSARSGVRCSPAPAGPRTNCSAEGSGSHCAKPRPPAGRSSPP